MHTRARPQACQKMRGKFKSVSEYRDMMVLVQFEYLPFIKARTGAPDAPAVFKASRL